MIERYGYFLPKILSFCSVEYMHGVLDGKRYAPKYEDVKLRPCPRPPVKEEVLKEVIKALPEGKSLGDTSKH